MNSNSVNKALNVLLVLILAFIFIALGNWQLDRARETSVLNSRAALVDSTTYPLEDLTSVTQSLVGDSVGKLVTASGFYTSTFRAPNQVSADESVNDWEVALMQIGTSDGLLVLRGLWRDRALNEQLPMSTRVTVVGKLQPRQFEDRAENIGQDLSRLDSSVITSRTDLNLYDGFIIAQSEVTRNGEIVRPRLDLPAPKPVTHGYYWQHISYVGIWWLMAAVVLFLPFYRRRVLG